MFDKVAKKELSGDTWCHENSWSNSRRGYSGLEPFPLRRCSRSSGSVWRPTLPDPEAPLPTPVRVSVQSHIWKVTGPLDFSSNGPELSEWSLRIQRLSSFSITYSKWVIIIKLTMSNQCVTGNNEDKPQMSLIWNNRYFLTRLVVRTIKHKTIHSVDQTCFSLLTRIIQWERSVSKGKCLTAWNDQVAKVSFSLEVRRSLEVLEARRAAVTYDTDLFVQIQICLEKASIKQKVKRNNLTILNDIGRNLLEEIYPLPWMHILSDTAPQNVLTSSIISPSLIPLHTINLIIIFSY